MVTTAVSQGRDLTEQERRDQYRDIWLMTCDEIRALLESALAEERAQRWAPHRAELRAKLEGAVEVMARVDEVTALRMAEEMDLLGRRVR